VFCTRSVRQLRDATIEELLGALFSVRSVRWCYKQDKSRFYLVVRHSPASKDVNTEAEESRALEAVTSQRLVKTHQTMCCSELLSVWIAICKLSINVITNPNPVCSHTSYTWHYYQPIGRHDPGRKMARWLDVWGRNRLTFADEDDEVRATLDCSGWRSLLTWIKNNISETGLCPRPQVKSLPSWAQSMKLVPVSGHHNQHKVGYMKPNTT
jgi:hypothetical protein